ncbi:protease SohB [Erwinia sp. HR93]|uniref:protease SohB n=1 Tax=Erwinia sp. HR93 TaxID=3094840 RepID=UPI002ADEC1CC|nr:protease SohB [Erwinia sp. HR93]MEA1064914.1 protease SohB [Erwinia sp. HR93]
MNLIIEYGLFLARVVTVVVAIGAVVMIVTNVARRKKAQRGELHIMRLNEQYEEMRETLEHALLDEYQQKARAKALKQRQKQEAKAAKAKAKKEAVQNTGKSTLYVLDFKGSMDAHEVAGLREEITAVLAVVKPQDEVLLRLESPGGVVHGYGLAASQLQRLRARNISLTVAVDKVAASGGYMMACVASRIVAAPFAIIGSIGVVAQVPNFHRLLKRNDIDVELHTAGAYKRTLTLFGENTPEGREKFRENLNDTHQLFKAFVHDMRPSLDVEAVATGEYWYGTQALEKGLIDETTTSDDWLIERLQRYDVVSVRYLQRKKMIERFTQGATEGADRLLLRWWQRGERPMP